MAGVRGRFTCKEGAELKEQSGLRWGILGCGNIGGKFARDLAAHGIMVAAAASRDSARASAFAEGLGIPRAYGGYEELLSDAGVDAIYVALPNHMHAEWSIRAARAGKHVLCEKPASLQESEAAAMADAARKARVFFMEGFMYALHPQWGLARALIEEDAIGPVRSIAATFCYDMGQKPGNIRLSPEAWGGSFADVGCYGVHFARRFAGPEGEGGEARIVSARARRGPEGVDERTELTLEFPGGVRAEIYCALRESRPASAVIHGLRGRIEIPQPWHPPASDAELRVFNDEGESVYKAGDGLAALAREAREVEEYADKGQSPTLTWEDALAQARLMEKVRKAVEWE
jgi:predicted dehydrogenase